jgi:hypothetical protein
MEHNRELARLARSHLATMRLVVVLGKYSKAFFIAGFMAACVLDLLPLLFDPLRSSSGFDLITLIFFPASLLFPFVEKAAPVTRHVAALFLVFLNGAVYALVGVLLDSVAPAMATKAERRIPIVPIMDLPMWRRTVVICSVMQSAGHCFWGPVSQYAASGRTILTSQEDKCIWLTMLVTAPRDT